MRGMRPATGTTLCISDDDSMDAVRTAWRRSCCAVAFRELQWAVNLLTVPSLNVVVSFTAEVAIYLTVRAHNEETLQ